jgi:hypothetical protein
MSVFPAEVATLVGRFADNRDAYHSPGYNETQTRREFIDPFFKALGWDVDNAQGSAQAYKDVIHEDAIKVGGASKAPDYCFRIGGTRKFFVEAKKPAVGLDTEPEPAYQLRRYAWTSKLPLSVLTDFEEFAVYDCRIRPHAADKPATARVFYCTCDQYADKWDWISGLFSKDAILKGAFDKYAESNKRKRGTAEVDAEFLKEIEQWRELLAQNFALRNPQLSVRDLNFAVQRTIDRVVFLRMCEDRGIEIYGGLQALLNGDHVYERLAVLFRRADDKYNSGLFYFTAEAGREPPDELTLGLKLDDKVLKEIIKGLYYPESPYEFSVLPPEILGQVYEQFLGKVIRLTAGHRAKVEEKPEVRKAGGVYYTPAYIVDYIVKNTVGKLLEGKTPAEIAPDVAADPRVGRRGVASPPRGRRGRRSTAVSAGARILSRTQSLAGIPSRPLRILDPACGSGSFLLGAYQYLLNWHRDWYVGQLEGIKGSRDQGIEGASPADDRSAGPPCPASSRRPLSRPSDADQSQIQNLKSKIYQGPGGQWFLTIQEKKRILLNHIYGVDIDPQAVETTKLSLLLKVLEGETEQTIDNNLRLFRERALPDLGRNIKCGNSLIGPDFYNNQQITMFDDEERLRINAFDWAAEFPEVFRGSGSGSRVSGSGSQAPSPESRAPSPDSGFDAVIGNPPYLFITEVPEADRAYYQRAYGTISYRFDLYGAFIEQSARLLLRRSGVFGFIIPHTLLSNDSFGPLRQLLSASTQVYHVVDFGPGVFKNARNETMLLFFCRKPPSADSTVDVVSTTPKQFPASVMRFRVAQREWILAAGDPWLVKVPPDTVKLLSRMDAATYKLADLATANQGLRTGDNEKYLSTEKHGEKWKPAAGGKDVSRYAPIPAGLYVLYEPESLDAPRTAGIFTAPEKIVIQEIRNIALPRRIVATLDRWRTFCLQSTNVVNRRDSCPFDVRYILGVLNSTPVNSYFRWRFGGNNHIASNQLLRIPVPGASPDEHGAVVALVQQMLDLHKQLAAAKTPDVKTALQRQIDATDRQIDRLVYELYGFTDEEIRIVEESTAR